MASNQEQQRLFDLAGKAQTLVKACQALTLTNNPDGTLRAAELAAEAAVAAKLSGASAGTSKTINSGDTVTVANVNIDGVSGDASLTFTIVGGVITAVVIDTTP